MVSIHTLRKLKAVIDFENDLMVLRGLNTQKLIPLQRSAAGHQLISLTDDLYKDAITCKSQVPGLKTTSRDISSLILSLREKGRSAMKIR